MLNLDIYRLDLEQAKAELAELTDSLAPLERRKELEELERQSQDPELWNDQERARSLQKAIKDKQRILSKFDQLEESIADLEAYIDLLEEGGGESFQEEFRAAHKAALEALEKFRLQTLFTGEHDAADALLSLHAGAGGTEAQDWVEMLYRMYSRFLEREGFSLEVLDYLDGDEAGIKHISIQVEGAYAYGYLQAENGVHRLVRISPFDTSGRRHTSFASVEVVPILSDDIEIEIKPDDLRVDYYRASGAGGQHVNKTESAVRLTHLPTGIVVACQNERSQIQNKEVAMRMLKAKLYARAEAEQKSAMAELKGEQSDNAWGSQIRSYVFCPYTLVKDHRTGTEVGDINAVMDGEIEQFISAYLLAKSKDEKR
ncbi:MAG: peptide chain release factor 2 [Eubacteriales bacterium]|nr:peptide chain release factor 2 [Eubacteriales bacterium]